MKNIQYHNLNNLFHEVEELHHFSNELEPLFKTTHKPTAKEIKKYFEDLIDKINAGKSGSGDFNFYPSDKYSACKNLCISIATKQFGHAYDKDKKRTGFKGLIKELICYWLSCGSINQKTIIFTFDWDSQAFDKKWRGIIDHYRSLGKEVIIFEIIEERAEYIQIYPSV